MANRHSVRRALSNAFMNVRDNETADNKEVIDAAFHVLAEWIDRAEYPDGRTVKGRELTGIKNELNELRFRVARYCETHWNKK